MTALPPPVSALEARLGLPDGSLTGGDLARATAAVEDATALVLAEVSTARATVWATTAPNVVVTVVLKAARREYQNPRGLAGEGLGDYSWSASDASGVYLTDGEIAQVRRAATGTPAGGFTGTVRTPSAYYDPTE